MRWLDRYVAIPFKDKGRDFAGADCMGLYILILAHEAKIAIDDPGVSFGSDPRAVMRTVESELHSGNWMTVADGDGAMVKPHAKLFDIVLMSAHVRTGRDVTKSDLHMGCALGNGFMIHTEAGSGAQYVALDDLDVCGRVKAVLRPKALCA